MATYYWLGTVSNDVNDNRNWTLWAPGGTYPPYAPTKPVWGSTIIFADYPIQGLSFTFPFYGPSGTLTGNTISPGNTNGPRHIASTTVKGNFKKPIGSSSSPLSIASAYTTLFHDAGGYTAAYINFLPHPTTSTVGFISIISQDGNVSYYITGAGTLYTQNTTYPTYSNIYLYNFIDGSVNSWGPQSNDTFWMDTTTSIGLPMTFVGNNTINVTKGFAVQNDKYINLKPANQNNTLTMNLLPVGISGSSGPAEYTQSTLRVATYGSNPEYPRINVYHGTDFVDLMMQSGHIYFAPAGPNDGCRIFEGTMNSATSKMTISDTADVTLMDPFSSYLGMSVESTNSSNTPQQIPIYYNGNARVSLASSNHYWNAQGLS